MGIQKSEVVLTTRINNNRNERSTCKEIRNANSLWKIIFPLAIISCWFDGFYFRPEITLISALAAQKMA